MFRIIPYRPGSRSVRALRTSLGGSIVSSDPRLSTFQQRVQRRIQRGLHPIPRGDIIINWGNTDPFLSEGVLNGTGIRTASNKRDFFQAVFAAGEGDIIPEFWTDRAAIPADAYPVVCRTVLAGHSGEGIVIANSADELVPAPLYVRYIKKKSEFRIHVGFNLDARVGAPVIDRYVIISEQRKTRRADHENPNWQIRNHANGFIFQRNDIVVPETVRDVAKRALAVTELDFGAVDVIFNEGQQRAYVLEINTAPGLEGQTVTDYTTFFRQFQ